MRCCRRGTPSTPPSLTHKKLFHGSPSSEGRSICIACAGESHRAPHENALRGCISMVSHPITCACPPKAVHMPAQPWTPPRHPSQARPSLHHALHAPQSSPHTSLTPALLASQARPCQETHWRGVWSCVPTPLHAARLKQTSTPAAARAAGLGGLRAAAAPALDAHYRPLRLAPLGGKSAIWRAKVVSADALAARPGDAGSTLSTHAQPACACAQTGRA